MVSLSSPIMLTPSRPVPIPSKSKPLSTTLPAMEGFMVMPLAAAIGSRHQHATVADCIVLDRDRLGDRHRAEAGGIEAVDLAGRCRFGNRAGEGLARRGAAARIASSGDSSHARFDRSPWAHVRNFWFPWGCSRRFAPQFFMLAILSVSRRGSPT